MTEAGGPRALRLSDFDREQAVDDLKAHAAAGRLSVDELAERVAGAYGASTLRTSPLAPRGPPARARAPGAASRQGRL